MLNERQGGRCAGCLQEFDLSTVPVEYYVDHDHATGLIRGILCRGCNFALGSASDAAATLRRLAGYIESPPMADLGLYAPGFDAPDDNRPAHQPL